jgi:hypothetical protein
MARLDMAGPGVAWQDKTRFPQMPVDWSKYPADWKDIARAVKIEADWTCEQCGKQCRRPGEPFRSHTHTLTVAHCNHVEADCRPENLAALCAPCHLRYDAPMKAQRRRQNKQRKARVGFDGCNIEGKTR